MAHSLHTGNGDFAGTIGGGAVVVKFVVAVLVLVLGMLVLEVTGAD